MAIWQLGPEWKTWCHEANWGSFRVSLGVDSADFCGHLVRGRNDFSPKLWGVDGLRHRRVWKGSGAGDLNMSSWDLGPNIESFWYGDARGMLKPVHSGPILGPWSKLW